MVERRSSLPDADLLPSSAHLELLRLLEAHPDYTQRQMAIAMGVSIGKTHYVLKALLNKGWVKVQNFQRNANKLGYVYVLTPKGLTHRLQLTQSFLAHKEAEYRALKSEIAVLRDELQTRGRPVSASRDSV